MKAQTYKEIVALEALIAKEKEKSFKEGFAEWEVGV